MLGGDVGDVFQKQIKDEGKPASSSRLTAQVVHPRSGLHYALYNCAKPTIAAINGPAVGIGLTLTLLQDIRIMAEEASIGAIFARMGLMPELGSTFMLPRLIGLAKALELTYTGKSTESQRSPRDGPRQPGCRRRRTDDGSPRDGDTDCAMPPLALTVSKRALLQGAESDFDAAVQTETFRI